MAYYRYSDDILLFADSKAQPEEYEALLYRLIDEKGLRINPDKVRKTSPGEGLKELGFRSLVNEFYRRAEERKNMSRNK